MRNDMKNIYFIFLVPFILISCRVRGGVFIVIHGTWASASSWSTPGDTFFDVLEKHALQKGHRTITYTWSGVLDETHRASAGKALAKLIRSYPAKTEFYIVAHSHGGNVAVVASQELAKYEKNNHRIKVLYSLATPIDPNLYMPDMDIIESMYNFFSLNDAVQPVLGFFQRTYPSHERIANIRVYINGKEPDHSSIHHPAIARWIPKLHDMLMNLECSPIFAFKMPGIIEFSDSSKPLYTMDIEREALLKKDRTIHEQMCALFRNPSSRLRLGYVGQATRHDEHGRTTSDTNR